MLNAFAYSKPNRALGTFQRLQDELNASLVEFRNGLMATQGSPSLNVWQKEGVYLIRLELAGVEEDSVKLETFKNELKISGERQLNHTGTDQTGIEVIKSERHSGAIERQLQFPFHIDSSKTHASLKDGILEIHLSPVAELGPTQIRIDGQKPVDDSAAESN